MAYLLRNGLSYCAVEDRLVFLDLPSDRYFCLSPAIETEFRRLVETPAADGAALERLLPRNLAVPHEWQHGISHRDAPAITGEAHGEPEKITALGSGQAAERSDFLRLAMCDAPAITGEAHGEPEKITALGSLTAAGWILRCRTQLKVGGLARTIQHLVDRKAAAGNDAPTLPASHDRDRTLARVAGSFHVASSFIGTHKRCLPWSLAIAHRLVSQRISPLLVLGVRLTPFAAHAWVQVDSTLIGERRERTDMFTPILVV